MKRKINNANQNNLHLFTNLQFYISKILKTDGLSLTVIAAYNLAYIITLNKLSMVDISLSLVI